MSNKDLANKFAQAQVKMFSVDVDGSQYVSKGNELSDKTYMSDNAATDYFLKVYDNENIKRDTRPNPIVKLGNQIITDNPDLKFSTSSDAYLYEFERIINALDKRVENLEKLINSPVE